jgi:3-deoxy-D-manno-octulosonic-acid transferase
LQQNKISTDFFADLSEEVNSVVIFNKVGYLKELYSFSSLAIVAGSIVFKKGHNFIEPVFCGSPVITGEFLKNYSELKKQFCDTKIIETFSNKEMLRTLVEKYSSPKKRNERLKIQKKALENLPGSHSGLIRSILDV